MLESNPNLAVISLFCLVLISAVTSQYYEDDTDELLSNATYHNNSELEQLLTSLAEEHSLRARLYSIGTSRRGNNLWVLELHGNLVNLNSAKPRLGVPHVKLVGNVHGNEPVGREMILQLAKHLLENYTTDSEVRWLMDNTRISLLPCLNPDGFELAVEKFYNSECDHNTLNAGRGNAMGVDLNKNFPDYFRKNQFRNEPESEALKRWMFANNFVLSASLHDGSLLVTYPFNSLESFNEWHVRERQHRRNPTPDDDVFQALAKVYTKANPKIKEGCKNSMKFDEGIINGAEDQPSVGTMADYNYHAHGCMELTLKISCCTYPPAKQLETLWNENKQALMLFLAQSHRGVRGQVRNEDGEPIEFAKVVVRGRDFHSNTSKNGEFWKVLTRSGLFTLQITASGYKTVKRYPFKVPEVENLSRPNHVWLDIKMKRQTGDQEDEMAQSNVGSSSVAPQEDDGVELLNWPAKNKQPENLAINSESESTDTDDEVDANSSLSTSEESRWDVFLNNYATIMIVVGLIALTLVVALICTEQFSARSFK